MWGRVGGEGGRCSAGLLPGDERKSAPPWISPSQCPKVGTALQRAGKPPPPPPPPGPQNVSNEMHAPLFVCWQLAEQLRRQLGPALHHDAAPCAPLWTSFTCGFRSQAPASLQIISFAHSGVFRRITTSVLHGLIRQCCVGGGRMLRVGGLHCRRLLLPVLACGTGASAPEHPPPHPAVVPHSSAFRRKNPE